MSEHAIVALIGWLAFGAFVAGAVAALIAARRLRPALQAAPRPAGNLRRMRPITGRMMGVEGARGAK